VLFRSAFNDFDHNELQRVTLILVDS